MLFSEIQRDPYSQKLYAEPEYKYLDRSALNEWSCIRSVLEKWFSNFPEKDRKDIESRFKSKHNFQHISAAFEIYLHELLIKLGYKVEIHPETNTDKETHPDFKAIGKDGNAFYLEAVQVTDTSQKKQGANSRLNGFYDAINRLKNSDFVLEVSFKDFPKTHPKGDSLRKKLSAWLNTLNADKVIDEYKRNCSLPQYIFYHKDEKDEDEVWIATFSAMPRSPEKRGKPVDKILGSIRSGAEWSTISENIRKSLIGKGNSYGKLDLPLIIAVNVSIYIDNIDVIETLFGKEEFIISQNQETRIETLPNGLWYCQNGPRYKRISGVLIGFDIKPCTYGVRKMFLYLNPWANYGVNGEICTLPVAKKKDGKIFQENGLHPKDILQLPKCYPGVQN